MKIIRSGSEGSIKLNKDSPQSKSFFNSKYENYLGCYEVSDVIHDKILSLPVSPEHTRDDVLYVCEAINEWKS